MSIAGSDPNEMAQMSADNDRLRKAVVEACDLAQQIGASYFAVKDELTKLQSERDDLRKQLTALQSRFGAWPLPTLTEETPTVGELVRAATEQVLSATHMRRATEDECERKRCNDAITAIADNVGLTVPADKAFDLLMSERAAVRAEQAMHDALRETSNLNEKDADHEVRRAAAEKAGYRRGRQEGFEHGRKERDRVLTAYLEQQDKVEDMVVQVHEFQDRCNADVAAEQEKLTALQSRYDLLVTAVRERLPFLERSSLNHDVLAAALPAPEPEEKKT